MIVLEHNKINNEPYLRVTSDKENHFVKVKGSESEPTNEIMIKGEETELEFEEVFVEPVEEEIGGKENEWIRSCEIMPI